MKVVLKEDLKKLGKKWDVVKVADGYARNYLFPKNLAVEANEANLTNLGKKKKDHQLKDDRDYQKCVQTSNLLSSKIIKIASKSGQEGKLFGSVTSQDVYDAVLEQTCVEIDKRKIKFFQQIKHTGTHKVEVSLHPKVQAEITLEVEG